MKGETKDSLLYVIDSVHDRFTVFVKKPAGNAMFQRNVYAIFDNDDAEVLGQGADLMALWIEAVHKTKIKHDYLANGGARVLKEGAL
jgi:hypothetical protein